MRSHRLVSIAVDQFSGLYVLDVYGNIWYRAPGGEAWSKSSGPSPSAQTKKSDQPYLEPSAEELGNRVQRLIDRFHTMTLRRLINRDRVLHRYHHLLNPILEEMVEFGLIEIEKVPRGGTLSWRITQGPGSRVQGPGSTLASETS